MIEEPSAKLLGSTVSVAENAPLVEAAPPASPLFEAVVTVTPVISPSPIKLTKDDQS